MLTRQLNQHFELPFNTQDPSSGEQTDADALPTYRVYEEDNNVAVATGTCAKRDDDNTVGYYIARGQILEASGYEDFKLYFVRAQAIIAGVTGANPVGCFQVVPTGPYGQGGSAVVIQLYETGTTNPIVGAVATLWDSGGNSQCSPYHVADANGQVQLGVVDGDYLLVPAVTPAYAWQDTPWAMTVSGPGTHIFYGTPWAPDSPSEPDVCRVFAWIKDIATESDLDARLHVTEVISPETLGSGDTEITVIRSANPAAFNNEGYAYIDIVREAVVSLRVTTTAARPRTKKRVTIPDQATVNWEALN